jgi:hypothetical protein
MKKDILNNKELNSIRKKYQKVIRCEEKSEIKKKTHSELYDKWLKDSKE